MFFLHSDWYECLVWCLLIAQHCWHGRLLCWAGLWHWSPFRFHSSQRGKDLHAPTFYFPLFILSVILFKYPSFGEGDEIGFADFEICTLLSGKLKELLHHIVTKLWVKNRKSDLKIRFGLSKLTGCTSVIFLWVHNQIKISVPFNGYVQLKVVKSVHFPYLCYFQSLMILSQSVLKLHINEV